MTDRLETYADWLVKNEGKRGTFEFETVVKAYKELRQTPEAPMEQPAQEASPVQVTAPENQEQAVPVQPQNPAPPTFNMNATQLPSLPTGPYQERVSGPDDSILTRANNAIANTVGPYVQGVVNPFYNFLDDVIPDPQVSAVNAARDAAVGVTTFPIDVAGMAGVNGADEISNKISQTVPRAEAGTAENIASAVLRFGTAGMGAGMKAAGLADDALRNVSSVSPFVQKAATYIAGLLGAGAGDVVVANPDGSAQGDQSIGEIFSAGPTDFEEDDSRGAKRIKLGAETFALAPVADVAINTVKRVVSGVRDVLAGLRTPSPEQVQEAINAQIQRVVRETGEDPEKVAEAILKTVEENPNAMATAGQASNEESLLSIERGLRQTPNPPDKGVLFGSRGLEGETISPQAAFAKRTEQQAESASKDVFDVTNQGIDDATRLNQRQAARSEIEGQQRAGEARTVAREQAAKRNLDDAAENVEDVTVNQREQLRSGRADAEQNLATEADQTRLARRNESSQKFEDIDPDGTLNRDTRALSMSWKRTMNPDSAKNSSEAASIETARSYLPKQILDDLDAVSAGGQKPFRDIQALRPKVSAALNKARMAGEDGNVISRLDNLKRTVEGEAERLVKQAQPPGARPAVKAAAARVEDAKRTFIEYASRWKEAGTPGAQFTAARRKTFKAGSENITPFIKKDSTGTQAVEAARQFRMIVDDMADVPGAEKSVTDMVMARLADSTQTLSTKKINEFISTHSQFLDEFPQTRRALQDLAKNVDNATGAAANAKAAFEEAKQFGREARAARNTSAAAKFLEVDDASEAVGKALSGDTPIKSINELLGRAGQDATGEATEGVKQAAKDWLYKQATTTKGAPGSDNANIEMLQASRATLEKLMGPTSSVERRQALRRIFGEQGLKTLDEVRKRMNIAARQSMTTIAGSNTIQNSGSKDVIKTEQARILVAAYFGITKGRGIFTITRWVSNLIKGPDAEKRVARMLTETMLDPERAAAALKAMPKNADPNANQIAAIRGRFLKGEITEKEAFAEIDKLPQAKAFKTYIANNLPDAVAKELSEDAE